MKWLRDNWFMLLLFLATIIMAYILVAGSCKKPTAHDTEKKTVDSLTEVIGTLKWATAQKIDSYEKTTQEFFEGMQSAESERSQLNIELLEANQKMGQYQKQFSLYEGKWDSASVITALSICDSMSNGYNDYRQTSENKFAVDDSIITWQGRHLRDQDSIISLHQAFNSKLDSAFKVTTDSYNNLFRDYSKLTRQTKKSNLIQKAMALVIAGETGKILLDLLKK